MLQVERYVLSIDPCRGVTDEAMASMLSSWVNSTIHEEAWIHDDFVRSLMCNHALRGCDIEEMSIHILNALEGSGLYGYLLSCHRAIDIVKCMVKGNMAYLELEWARKYEDDCTPQPAKETDNLLHER